MTKDIFIILPFKESLNPNLAGAVSLYVKDTTKYSKFKKRIEIISSDNFLGKTKLFRNRNYIINFCKKYKNKKIKLIEIHNRPEYIKYIKNYFPNTKINIIFHNDPLSIRGSITKSEREKIVSNCSKVIFISRWIQQRFFSSFKNSNLQDTEIIPHGVDKEKNIVKKNKLKNILFVAKLNKSKGYKIFCDAAKKFKNYDPSWNFIAIGNEMRKKIFPDQNIVNEIGYKKNSEVLDFYKKSEIAVGNSVWDEPLGRIAIEASSRKCLPIISNKGGLAESKNIAIVLKKNDVSNLFQILKKVTKNHLYRRKKQDLFYKNNKFDLNKITLKLDKVRDNVFDVSKNIINKNLNADQKRILHIANFNENSDGRLYYSFANKLNVGFIKNNYIVQTISDRYFLRLNRSIIKPFNSNIKFNEKIMNTLKNFSPQVLVIGHVYNIDNEIFEFCKLKKIKIVSWFIDSISPEFLNQRKKNEFDKNLNYVDYCFLTSSPKIFKKHKNFKKLKFIPNPVDTSIDFFKNYNKKNLEYDLFVAISHGQNRGILKAGKTDEREYLINKLIENLPQSKIAQFGLNNFEPVWGSNYYHYLSKSKMALNISRGKYQNNYSSDRISSLIGNGLLTFINKKTNFNNIFNKNEVVYYKDILDLIKKIKYYTKKDKLRKKIARAGYVKYHKFMNNIIITKYMMSCIGLEKIKKPFWYNI